MQIHMIVGQWNICEKEKMIIRCRRWKEVPTKNWILGQTEEETERMQKKCDL